MDGEGLGAKLLLSRRHLTRLDARDERPGLSFTNATLGPLSIGRATFDLAGDLRGSDWSAVDLS